ncbi:MAG: dihydrolipoamide acetyltransferase family protein [Actinomycetales bacterium]
MQVFLLPDLGEGLTEAELVNWLVQVGDTVAVDQAVAEVETAKAVVEVPSPYAGVVAELHGTAGQTLDVGKPLISISPASDSAAPAEAAPVVAAPTDAAPAPTPAEAPGTAVPASESAGSGNVLIGYGTSGNTGSGRTRPRKTTPSGESGTAAAAPTAAGPAADGRAPLQTPSAPAPAAPALDGRAPLVSSPLVRRLAKENGIALRSLSGSGADGLILRRDVEAAVAAAHGAATPSSSGTTDARTGLAVARRTPFKGMRKLVAANMARSRREIPEATVWVDVDATALVQLRARLKGANAAPVPGLLAFVARFALAGLAKFPELNTRVEHTDDGDELVAFDGVNLGFAVQSGRGLVVPSIENAQRHSARSLDAEIRRLTAAARDGKATPAELGRGTFTVNNYGVFGVDGSAAIINHPEVAMLGIGRIIERPWVVEGQLAVRSVTELTLAFDHRVCDGGTAGGFLRYVADAIENPGTVLADL